MTLFAEFNKWLSEKPNRIIGTRILQICIGMAICFRIATELPFAQYLWGPHGISLNGSASQFFGPFLGRFFDSLFFGSPYGIYLLLFMLFLGAISLVINIKTRIAALVCFIAFVILELRLPAIGDGGDNISRLTLMYMVLLTSNPSKENINKLKVWIHNIGIACIITQLMILYETSGFMKITGEKWQNGTAMYLISNVEWFSIPGMRELFTNPIITTVSSYVPMIFMIMFPVAIFSRFKLVWIGIGICLHMGIALFMGLITFSTVMIGLELFLITDAEYKQLKITVVNSLIYKNINLQYQNKRALIKNYIKKEI